MCHFFMFILVDTSSSIIHTLGIVMEEGKASFYANAFGKAMLVSFPLCCCCVVLPNGHSLGVNHFDQTSNHISIN